MTHLIATVYKALCWKRVTGMIMMYLKIDKMVLRTINCAGPGYTMRMERVNVNFIFIRVALTYFREV